VVKINKTAGKNFHYVINRDAFFIECLWNISSDEWFIVFVIIIRVATIDLFIYFIGKAPAAEAFVDPGPFV